MILTLTAAAAALLLASYTGVAGLVAQRFTSAQRKAPDTRVAQEVRFAARDGQATIAAAYLPVAEPRGAVVFVHGKDACRASCCRVRWPSAVRSPA